MWSFVSGGLVIGSTVSSGSGVPGEPESGADYARKRRQARSSPVNSLSIVRMPGGVPRFRMAYAKPDVGASGAESRADAAAADRGVFGYADKP